MTALTALMLAPLLIIPLAIPSYTLALTQGEEKHVAQNTECTATDNRDAATILDMLRGRDDRVDAKGLTFTDIALAGMLGNFERESGVTFKASQGRTHDDDDNAGARAYAASGMGLGMAQWTSGRGVALVDLAEGVGGTWSDARVQGQQLVDDLTGAYAGVYRDINKASSASEAAKIFHDRFEISADGPEMVGLRQKYAEKWLPRIQAGLSCGGVQEGKAGDAPEGGGNYAWMCDATGICHDHDGLDGEGGSLRNFYTNNFSRYQCVWYAWNRLAMIHGTEGWTFVGGHGGQIAGKAAAAGWTVSAVPKAGDGVSQFGGALGGDGECGHVAVVEEVKVTSDGWRIRISEGNWGVGGSGAWNGYNSRWLDSRAFAGAGRVFFRSPAWK